MSCEHEACAKVFKDTTALQAKAEGRRASAVDKGETRPTRSVFVFDCNDRDEFAVVAAVSGMDYVMSSTVITGDGLVCALGVEWDSSGAGAEDIAELIRAVVKAPAQDPIEEWVRQTDFTGVEH